MSERIRIYPLYLTVLMIVSAVIVYESYRLGGLVPALFLFVLFSFQILCNIQNSISVDSERIVVKRLFRKFSIPVGDILGIVYYHAPGGRDFYQLRYLSPRGEKTLRMNSFMYKNLYRFMHTLERAGVQIAPFPKKYRIIKWMLFLLFAIEGGYCLRELALRVLSYLANALSGVYYLDDFTEVWVILSLFFLISGYRLFRRLKGHHISTFISRSLIFTALGMALIILVSGRGGRDHRMEMYRTLLDTKYAIESHVFDYGTFPEDPEKYLQDLLKVKSSLRRGWKKAPVGFYYDTSVGDLGSLSREPGRVIILNIRGDVTYLATFLNRNGVNIISEDNNVIPINRLKSRTGVR